MGSSGSGKSTVTALLPRFYDVAAGRITVDGVDIRDVTLDSLRRQVGVVFEDAFLFSDSIRSNIAYGRPDATDAEVRAAAVAAGAERFIDELSDGYDTVVGERGLTLSGGQRQRIALARAIITNPRVLVLDDATSAVDATTEQAIHDTLREIMEDRTTILIAHRRSTLRLASRIVVIDGGRVVDQGTHEELLVTSARYRDLLGGPDIAPDDDGTELDGADGELAPVSGSVLAFEDEDEVEADALGVGAVTASAWTAADSDAPVAQASVAAAPRFAPGGGGNFGAALAATPELLAALEQLPPTDDLPNVDVAAVTAEDPEPFRVTRFIRPWRRWLSIGLVLVVIDTFLTLLGPLFVRRGIDQGVETGNTTSLWWSVAFFAAAVLADWVVTWGYTLVTGLTAERMLFGLRVKIFAHLQRLSLGYYDRELGGRIMTRMTTDVEALSQLVQTGLINAVVGLFTCVGVFVFLVILSPPLALAAAVILPAAVPRHLVVPAPVVGRLRQGPRLHRRRERQLPGEPLRRAGHAGLRARGAQRARLPLGQPAVPRPPVGSAAAHRPLLPVRAPARRPRRRVGAGRRLAPQRARGDHDRCRHRVPPLPRPVLLADPAAVPGARHLAAGRRVGHQDRGAAHHADRHPRGRAPDRPASRRRRGTPRRRPLPLPEHRRSRGPRRGRPHDRAGRDGRARR